MWDPNFFAFTSVGVICLVIDIFWYSFEIVHERSIMEMKLPGMQMETILFGMSTIQLSVMVLVSQILHFLLTRLFHSLDEIVWTSFSN